MNSDTTSKPFAVWITGISGVGKTTLADILQSKLGGKIVDGDTIRKEQSHISSFHHPFGREGRRANVYHGAKLAKSLLAGGYPVFVSLISPYASDRSNCVQQLNDSCGGRVLLVHLTCSMKALSTTRDHKQIYARAAAGSLKHVSGYDAPYEAPTPSSCLSLDTEALSPQQVADAVEAKLRELAFIA
jgi:adenylylsulfate kinase-like enzyme